MGNREARYQSGGFHPLGLTITEFTMDFYVALPDLYYFYIDADRAGLKASKQDDFTFLTHPYVRIPVYGVYPELLAFVKSLKKRKCLTDQHKSGQSIHYVTYSHIPFWVGKTTKE